MAFMFLRVTTSASWLESCGVWNDKEMPDYVYLLDNRLSAYQRNALKRIREAAREAGMILFLTGDAVRDLTSGHAVRELEVAVHGNAHKLKKPLEKAGAKVWGEDPDSHSLFLCFPGTVRADIISTHRLEYPKPGKAVYHTASIQEDLRRRDFTVNAMAISLNEGSFGLLMDPLNGAADIESRTLRLVSNYGFLEDPSLLIRATRYKARLSWDLDPRTHTRYENAKAEGVIDHLSPTARSRELEQIGHEEEGLRVLKALEDEGWMKVLFPAWTSAKADTAKLQSLHDLAADLLMQGIHSDMSAAQMELLTSGLSSKEASALKRLMHRPGFVEEWNSLGDLASGFQKELLSKANAIPSAAYKLFTSYDPEAVLWLGFISKSAAVQERYNDFLKVWPEARQRIPHALMQEMRITPELASYNEIVYAVFLQLIDGKLSTVEEMRAFLEPHSPPAPPPPVSIKRPRVRREAKLKVLEEEEEAADDDADEEDLDDLGADEEEVEIDIDLVSDDLAGDDLDHGDEEDTDSEEEVAEPKQSRAKPAAKPPVPAAKPAKPVKPAAASAKTQPTVKAAPAPAPKAKEPVPPAAKPVKHAPAPAAKKSPPPAKSKPAPKPKPAPAHKKAAPAKAAKTAKPAASKSAKPGAKPAAKPVAKPAPAKGKPSKPAAKKPAKPAKKR